MKDRDLLGWAAMLACIAVTAHGEWSLALACGYAPAVAAGLPVAIDAYALRSMQQRREILPPVLLMIATNVAAHLLHGGMLTVTPWLIGAVSAVAPVVLWRVHALRHADQDEPAPAAVPVAEVRAERVPEAAPAAPVAVPALGRPHGGVYPELAAAVPEDHFAEVRKVTAAPVPAPVYPAAEPDRTRVEVRAEYVPEQPHPAYPDPGEPVPEHPRDTAEPEPTRTRPEPEPEYTPAPAEVQHADPVPASTPRAFPGVHPAVADFQRETERLRTAEHDTDDLTREALVDFSVTRDTIPSIRALRDRYGIGQTRATRIQSELKKAMP